MYTKIKLTLDQIVLTNVRRISAFYNNQCHFNFLFNFLFYFLKYFYILHINQILIILNYI